MAREDGDTVILGDMQAMYGNLLMGAGTPYDLAWDKLGLLDAPPIRASDTDRARGDGVWTGEEWAGAQTFPFSVQMFGRAGIDIGVAVRTLLAETTLRTPRDLWFKVPHLSEARCLQGVRVRRRAVPIARGFGHVVKAEFDLFAPDPARYGPEMTLQAQTVVQPVVAGVNQGDLDSWPVFYLSHPTGITGPVTITHEDSGSVIAISTTTGPGQALAIDPSVGTAIVDYIVDKGADLTSRQWWSIPPGSTFTVRVAGQSGLRMDVVWRPSWW